MQIGFVGLGTMGLGIASRLAGARHDVVAFDRDANAGRGAAKITLRRSLDSLVAELGAPRVVWLMLPAGDPTTQTVEALAGLLDDGDIVVDGGNSHYKEAAVHASLLAKTGVHFLDVGTSGGTSGGARGEDQGYCLTVGGEPAASEHLAPVFDALAVPGGWGHLGPSGAGHFAKMVHDGIEHGVMQAYAEGFAMLDAKHSLDIDLGQLAKIWLGGSMIRSWLLELIAETFETDQALAAVAPRVADSGAGRWAVHEAVDLDLPAPVMTGALLARLGSREERGFGTRLLSVLRQRFDGHAVETDDSDE